MRISWNKPLARTKLFEKLPFRVFLPKNFVSDLILSRNELFCVFRRTQCEEGLVPRDLHASFHGFPNFLPVAIWSMTLSNEVWIIWRGWDALGLTQLEDRICEKVRRPFLSRSRMASKWYSGSNTSFLIESVRLIHPRVIPLRGWKKPKKFQPDRPSGSRDIASEKSRRLRAWESFWTSFPRTNFDLIFLEPLNFRWTFRWRCQKEGS